MTLGAADELLALAFVTDDSITTVPGDPLNQRAADAAVDYVRSVW